MKNKKLSCIYFSAAGSTKQCVEEIAAAIGLPVETRHNLADIRKPCDYKFGKNDVVVFGAPVYGGRIPSIMADRLSQLEGNGALAISVVVYGNRDYDDALLELTDIVSRSGFRTFTAGAFIGCHSIFPKVGASRPDKADVDKLREFGRLCRSALEAGVVNSLPIKGKRPYKKYGGVPVHPVGNESKCRKCGVCSKLCPAEAINPAAPWTTDAEKCISCGRCIASCPSGVRQYAGLKYKLIEKAFTAMFSTRKEPEYFI